MRAVVTATKAAQSVVGFFLLPYYIYEFPLLLIPELMSQSDGSSTRCFHNSIRENYGKVVVIERKLMLTTTTKSIKYIYTAYTHSVITLLRRYIFNLK